MDFPERVAQGSLFKSCGFSIRKGTRPPSRNFKKRKLRYKLPEPESGDLFLRLRVLVYILLVFLLLSVLQEPNPLHDLFGDQRGGSNAVPRDRFASPQNDAARRLHQAISEVPGQWLAAEL